MTVIHKDITLNFPFDCEYTIDGGTTWTELLANTEVLIPSASLDPDTRKISIRSQSEDATTLSRDSLRLMDARYKEINIRNGSNLTSLNSFLSQCVVDDFYINHAPMLEDAGSMCHQGVYENINLCELPRLTNASSCFNSSVIHQLGNLNFGRLNAPSYTGLDYMFSKTVANIIGKVECSRAGKISYMFSESLINGAGHIDLSSPSEYTTANSSNYIFNKADIDCFPSVSLVSKSTSGATGWNYYAYQYMFRYNLFDRTGYLPSILLKGTPSTLNSGYDYRFLTEYANISTLRFGGLSLYNMGSNSNNYIFYYASKDTVGASYEAFKALFSTLNFNAKMNVPTTDNNDNMHGFLSSVDGVRPYYDNPDWFPTVKYLHTKMNVELIGTVGIQSVGMYNRIIKNTFDGVKYQANAKIQPAYECFFTEPEEHVSDDGISAIFCQNGNYAYQSGSDILVKDSDDILLSTILNKTLTTGNFSTDGTKLYLVFGGAIDRAGTEGQAIVNTIGVFDTSDGEQVGEDIVTTNDADEYVAGVYKAQDDYGLKIVKTKYSTQDASYQWLSSKCDSIYSSDDHGNAEATEDIPIDVHYVGNHYLESYEFVCVDPISGNTARMVGK